MLDEENNAVVKMNGGSGGWAGYIISEEAILSLFLTSSPHGD